MSKRKPLLLLALAAAAIVGGWATYRLLGHDAASSIDADVDSPAEASAVAIIGAPSADTDATTSADATGPVTDAAAATGARAPGEPLPLEKFFIVDGQLSLAAAQKSLTTDRFDKHMQMLETQMATEPDAMDLAKTYQAAIAEQLGKAGADASSQRFACGTSMCMGSLRSRSDAAYERWWQDFSESDHTPHSISLRHSVDLGGGQHEHRFLFVSDPAINSAVIPPTVIPPTQPKR